MKLKIIFRSIIMLLIVDLMADSLIFIGNQVPIVKDIEKSVLEVDITDYIMSHPKRLSSFELDTNITLVNIKWLERDSIGLLLSKIGNLKPKVTFVNATFFDLKDPYKDSLLQKGLMAQQNLVLPAVPNYSKINKKENCYPIRKSNTLFSSNVTTGSAYVHYSDYDNLIDKTYGAETGETVRYFMSSFTNLCEPLSHISVEILKIYDKNLYNDFLDKNKEITLINYTGSTTTNRFRYYEPEELFENRIKSGDFTDKIVIVGFLGDSTNSFKNEEGKLFTPLNKNLIRRTDEDMYGSEIIANIISMIINKNFILELSIIVNFLLNQFIVFASILLMNVFWTRYENKTFRIRILSYFMVGVMVISIIISFMIFNFKLDFRLAIFYLIIIPEIFSFYKLKIETLPVKLKNKLTRNKH